MNAIKAISILEDHGFDVRYDGTSIEAYVATFGGSAVEPTFTYHWENVPFADVDSLRSWLGY